MDIIKGFEELKEKLKQEDINIDISAINLREDQQYVLNLDTDERATVFTCFTQRGIGQSTAAILKAIQLSNLREKEILILCQYSSQLRYKRFLFEDIINRCDQSSKIRLGYNSASSASYRLSNGSNIVFRQSSVAALRGIRADYIIMDDVRLDDQERLDAAMMTIAPFPNGQAFFFPQIRDLIV